jgi:hypothetical protein
LLLVLTSTSTGVATLSAGGHAADSVGAVVVASHLRLSSSHLIKPVLTKGVDILREERQERSVNEKESNVSTKT